MNNFLKIKNLEIIKRTERTSPDWLWLEAAHEGVKKVLQYGFINCAYKTYNIKYLQ